MKTKSIRPLRIINLVLTFVIVLATHVVNAREMPMVKAEREGMSTQRLQRISDMSQRYVDENKLAGIVTMVARDGKIVHFDAVGQRGVDDPTPLKKDDLFRIYSMTKPITAVAIMQLYEQGKFQLSDPVSKFVPEFAQLNVLTADGELVPATRQMTMQQLLTHTAGFSYGFNPNGDPVDKYYAEARLWTAKNLDEFALEVAKLPLKFEPGDQWHYSIAVDVTGLIVQRLSGQPFNDYLKQHIFEPLGMVDTFFEVPQDKVDRFLPNHYIDPESGKLTTIPPDHPMFISSYNAVSLYSGGGGLVSTAMDYMRFAEALRNGGELDGKRILGSKTIEYMTRNHLPASIVSGGSGEQPTLGRNLRGFGFGLGFGLVTDPAAAGVMSSEGEFYWGGAAGTIFWIDPVENIVVVGMIQLMRSPYPFRADLKVGTYQAIIED